MNIIQNRYKFFIFSAALLIFAMATAIVNAATGKGIFDLDIDFSGGNSLTYDIGAEYDNQVIEQIVKNVTKQSSPRIQSIIGKNQVAIKMQAVTSATIKDITNEITAKYPNTKLINAAYISATVSTQMQKNALIAVLISCVAMLIYISIRFKDFKMGTSAIIALVHDILVMLAVYIVFRVPVNNSFIAAILTILGYSINSTIVVFDRIRENKKFFKKNEFIDLINTSITKTLARSINTSLTTLLTIVCVYVLGVSSVKEFALPIIIGIICGTYSSVFLAGSVWYELCTRESANA